MSRRVPRRARRPLSVRFPLSWLALAVIGVLPRELGSESLVLNAYYPSPLGIYANLTTTDQTLLARDGGKVGIGTPSPSSTLDVGGQLRAASGTEPDPTASVNGMIYYNTATNQFRAFQNGAWGSFGGTGMTQQIFTSNGAWSKPSGVKTIRVRMVGGGGGGFGSRLGGGGGGAGYCESFMDASSINSVPVTVGAAGTGGAGHTGSMGEPGTGGGNSAFLSFRASGGGGASSTYVPGGGGGASNCDINIKGSAGTAPPMGCGMSPCLPGNGGSSRLGDGGLAGTASHFDGYPGGGYGAAGGGGDGTNGGAGGDGSAGVVIVEEYR